MKKPWGEKRHPEALLTPRGPPDTQRREAGGHRSYVLRQSAWYLGCAAQNSALGRFRSGSWCPPAFRHSLPKALR